MPSLKELRNRIKSVKSTQKITKAMKMVAAAKLRRARERAEAARPYADHMARILASLARSSSGNEQLSLLLNGTGRDQKHLLVVITADRGLCGAFNGSIVRAARQRIQSLQEQGKEVVVFAIGKKGYEQLNMRFPGLVVDKLIDINKVKVSYGLAHSAAEHIQLIFEEQGCDICTVVYNRFKSAISQIVTFDQIMPLASDKIAGDEQNMPIYEYEPDEEAILEDLLKRNIAIQLFRALMESEASEHGARMTAMDNATRNAGDMIKKITLRYNRTRQAAITKELIEIISGAEAI